MKKWGGTVGIWFKSFTMEQVVSITNMAILLIKMIGYQISVIKKDWCQIHKTWMWVHLFRKRNEPPFSYVNSLIQIRMPMQMHWRRIEMMQIRWKCVKTCIFHCIEFILENLNRPRFYTFSVFYCLLNLHDE